MTSKNLYFKLMKEDLKRRLWAAGLAFLMFFFSMPVASAMRISVLRQTYESWVRNKIYPDQELALRLHEEFLDIVECILGIQNYFTVFVVGAAALVLGLTGFHFLHSKRQVDFYNSLPVRRELLFTVKYVNGFLIVFSMYLLNLFLAVGVFAVNGIGPGTTLAPALTALAVHAAGFLLIYGLMTIAVLLTGNFFVSILGGLVLFFYIPLAVLLGISMMEVFFMTVSYRQTSSIYKLMAYGSPFFSYAEILDRAGELGLEKCTQIFPDAGRALVAALVLFAICLILYRLRPSESAGKSIAFSAAKFPIKLLVVMMTTVFMGLIFWTAYGKLTWAVFGFLLGLVIPHCLFEIICFLDFKKLFENLHQMGICAAAALIVIGIFRYDIFGYDKYLPSEASFQSASVYLPDLGDWNGYGMPYKGGDKTWYYLSEDDYAVENMSVTDYDVIKELAEAGIAWAKEEKPRMLSSGSMYYELHEAENEGGFLCGMSIGYRLRNGRTVYRDYTVDVTRIRQAIDRLYVGGEYKQGIYPVLSYTANNVMGVYMTSGPKIREIELSEEKRAELLSTYQEELAGLTLDDRAWETPVTSLRFLTIAEHEYIRWISHNRRSGFNGDFHIDDMNQVNFFPVYPSFTKTIAVLKEAGIDMESLVSADEVAGIRLYYAYAQKRSDDDDYGYETETVSYVQTWQEDNSGITLVIENDGTAECRQKIEEILACAAPADTANLNGLQLINRIVNIEVYFKDEDAVVWTEGRSISYVFTDIEIPQFAAQALGYDSASNLNHISYGLNPQK